MVTLGVRDMPSMRAFYRSLGWPEGTDSNDTHSVFHLVGCFLALYPLDLLAEDANAGARLPDGVFRGVTLAINVEKSEFVDAGIERARSAGAVIGKEAVDADWGGRSGYFIDPEGNRWEVAWAPNAVFDERGVIVGF
jgi:catechol 2,3-dioxygenase-like lactoylglutathione lyase family enzyme